MLRNGLSYQQASANCTRIANAAYNEAIASGKTEEEAQDICAAAYNKEMEWYES